MSDTISPTPAPPPLPPSPKKRVVSKGALIGILLLLVIALPIGVYYVSQQDSLNDVRNRANEPPGPYAGVTNRAECKAAGGTDAVEPGAECGCGGYRLECVINGQYYKMGCEYNPNADCGGDYSYSQGTYQTNTPTTTPSSTPSHTPTGTPSVTLTPTLTPTGTPSVTLTPTPTPNLSICNSGCTVNADCAGGLVCIEGFCRNASCTEKTSCQCETTTPTPQTPIAGTGPSILGASVIGIGALLLLFGLAF
jgi:hypothetical protein